MSDFTRRVYKILRNLIFTNRRTRRFHSNLSMAPNKMDTSLRRMALRYLCHQLDKTIKHDFKPNNVRGKDKFERASIIFETLKNTKFADTPDVKWARQILERYKLWKSGEKKSFVVTAIDDGEVISISRKDFKEVVYSRRSVRFWSKKKVSKKILCKIIQMGIMAPSSCNRQPWRFIIVENTQKNPDNKGPGNKSMIMRAPYIIYVAIDERLYSEKYGPALDAGFVSQNILLAIEYFGLKACGMYQCETINQNKVKSFLGLPDHSYIYVAIPFGFPAEVVDVPERVKVENITGLIKLDAGKIVLYM